MGDATTTNLVPQAGGGLLGNAARRLSGRGDQVDAAVDTANTAVAANGQGTAQDSTAATVAAAMAAPSKPAATDYTKMSTAELQAAVDAIGTPKTANDAAARVNMRVELQRRASQAQQQPAATGDQQSSIGRDYRNVYRAPNGVVHDIYGPDTAAQGVAFHGGPGVPISGANHPAFIGQSISPDQGLVEYRIPQRDAALQQRLLAQRPA